MRVTNQVLAAGSVVLVALIASVGVFLGGVPSYPTPERDLTLAVDPATAPVDSAAVLDPLIPAHAGPRARNPFNLREELQRVEVVVPIPPPPPLASPSPPAVFDLGGGP